MKQIITALILAGFTLHGAQAQEKTIKMNGKTCVCKDDVKKAPAKKVVAHVNRKPATIKTTRTYQVCEEKDGYYTCCVHTKTIAQPAPQPAATPVAQPVILQQMPAGKTMTIVNNAVVIK